jgi:hypothetical protein
VLDESELANLGDLPPTYGSPVYWYPGYGQPWATGPTGSQIPTLSTPVAVERKIQEDNIPLKEGSKVIGSDGKEVGELERVLIDPDSNLATYLVMLYRAPAKVRKVIPIAWVRRIEENQVTLEVGSRFIDYLPHYEVKAA